MLLDELFDAVFGAVFAPVYDVVVPESDRRVLGLRVTTWMGLLSVGVGVLALLLVVGP